VLVAERNFAEFFGDRAHDDFKKCHESSLRVRRHGEVALERASAVRGANPKAEDKVTPQLKATVGLMRIEVVEFTMRSLARSPTGALAVSVLDRQPTKGSTQGR
jgi:hypothetical protein